MLKDVIRNYKSMLNLTNQQIADQAGISLRTVQRLLNGSLANPTMDILIGLAKCFDIPVDVLCDSYHEWIVRPDELRNLLMFRSLDDRHKFIVSKAMEEAMLDWHKELKDSFYLRKRNEYRRKVDSLTISQLEQILEYIRKEFPDLNEKI